MTANFLVKFVFLYFLVKLVFLFLFCIFILLFKQLIIKGMIVCNPLLCWEVLDNLAHLEGRLSVKCRTCGASASHTVVFPSDFRSLIYLSPLSCSDVLRYFMLITSCCLLPALIHTILIEKHSVPRALLELGIWILCHTVRCFCSCPGTKSARPGSYCLTASVEITVGSESGLEEYMLKMHEQNQQVGAYPPTGFPWVLTPTPPAFSIPLASEDTAKDCNKTDLALVKH